MLLGGNRVGLKSQPAELHSVYKEEETLTVLQFIYFIFLYFYNLYSLTYVYSENHR